MGVLNIKHINKLSSFTLIESVIAIIVIMICFWLSAMIYLNVVRADARLLRLQSFLTLKQHAIEVKQQYLFFDEETNVDSLKIKRHIEPYQTYHNLKVLNIEVFDSKQRKMASFKQIIIAP